MRTTMRGLSPPSAFTFVFRCVRAFSASFASFAFLPAGYGRAHSSPPALAIFSMTSIMSTTLSGLSEIDSIW